MRLGCLLFVLWEFAAVAQDGVPTRLVVTAEPHHGKQVPPLQREDAMVYEGKDRATVTEWVPARGAQASLQFYLLIDDGADTDLGTQLNDLRKFIRGLPASAEVGVGYMRNGDVAFTSQLTRDHEAAARSVRLPLGSFGISASPYQSLTELVQKWPAGAGRREVLMITSGIDLFYGNGPSNPYVDRAVEEAQKAGVLVHSIYFNSAGHAGHSYSQINWGQNYLSQLGDATGGEAYWQGFGNPVSFAPYLEDLERRLENQYLLTFLAKPERKAELRSVKVRTEVPNVETVSASRVWVRSGQ